MGEGPGVAEPYVEELAPGVFAYVQPDGSWYLSNTGFLLGEKQVISVDTCATAARTRRYLETIRSTTSLPLTTVVCTHHHGDHIWGNPLAIGATFVGYQRTRERMLADGPPGPPETRPHVTAFDVGTDELAPPFLTFRDEVTLWAAGNECIVRYVGEPAHTDNDSIVWLPGERVLFAGDLLFSGSTPLYVMGSVAGALNVLENVLKPLGARAIVCGHGPVGGPELVDENIAYLSFIWDAAQEGHRAGIDPFSLAMDLDLGEFAALPDAERVVGNIYRAYADLNGIPAGEAIDYAMARVGMVAFNGGKPMRCHA